MLPAIETAPPDQRDARFDAAAAQFAAPLARLARALEDDPARREALLQDIHVALWRSLADYDERIGLRTWVFRVAYNSVAAHQPNSHENARQQDTVSQAWKRRSSVREQRSLAEVDAPAGSTAGFIQGLEPFDRGLALLYLEGISAEAAMTITGATSARQEATWRRLAQLLPARAPEDWQRSDYEITPVSRVLVHSRIGDLRARRKRADWGQALVVSILSLAFVIRALLASKPRWMATASLAVLAVIVIVDAWKVRRRQRAQEESPEASSLGTLDLLAFHRRLLERQRDELRRGWGFAGWTALLGIALLLLSFPLERSSGWTWPAWAFGAVVAFFLGRLLADRAKANRLQARIATST